MVKITQRNKILYFFILPSFILCFCFIAGCSNSTLNTLETISTNMDKIAETVNEIDSLHTSELIISDFMDEDSIEEIPSDDVPALYGNSTGMYTYIIKLTLLNNSIYNTVQVNNSLNNVKKQLIAKTHQVKSLSEQCRDEKNSISNENLDSLEELNNTVMGNNTRAGLTKNEVKANLASIEEIKSQYSQKPEQLGTRYEKLQSSLNTRLSYYNNILSCLERMEYIIASNCDFSEITNTSNLDIELNNQEKIVITDKIKEETINDINNKESEKNDNSKKTSTKNIDTYENAGIKFWGNRKANNPINKDNYLNYGYYGNGMYPNPYFNGGYGMGYGNMYGYGTGIPYGFGGFGIPNINTFGTYKNIDTYRPVKPYTLDNENSLNNNTDNKNKENDQNEAYNEIVETSSNITSNTFIPKTTIEVFYGEILPDGGIETITHKIFEINENEGLYEIKTLEEPIIDDKIQKNEQNNSLEENELTSFAPTLTQNNIENEELIPQKGSKPYIPKEWHRGLVPAKPIYDNSNSANMNPNTEESEDKFVNAPYKNPKIEKLEQ